MPSSFGARPGTQPGGAFYPGPRQPVESFPIITSVSPDSDRVAGGISVTITGIRFAAGAVVTFGGFAATAVVVVSSTTITCTTPAVPEDIVDVVVTNLNGESGTLSLAFTFIAGHIIALSSSRGLTVGGTNVTIKGVNFVTGSTVAFGGVAATGVIFVDAQTIFCVTSPRTEGTVDVTITEPSTAVVTGKKLFTYTSAVFNSDIRRSPSKTIRQTLNSGPNSATFKIDQNGVPPIGGEKVTFTDLDFLLFSGEVTNVRQVVEGGKENWAWEVTALDDRFRFNRKRPFGTWDNVSVSTIARELLTNYAPEFFPDFIQSRLPRISLVLTGEDDMVTVFTKMAGALNEGHWYIDNGVVHLFQLASGLGSSESPVSALVMPAIGPMTVSVSTTSTLGYGFVPGYYYFMSMNGYGVPSVGISAKVYDSLSGTGVNVMANRANSSGVFINYGQGGTPSQNPLPNQTGAPLWIMLSEQAANRNLQGDISNGVYCGSGHLFARGWIGVDADGNIFSEGAWPSAGPNAIYFASSDVWFALEQASGTPAAPVQAYFESGLSQISNVVFLRDFLPSFNSVLTGPVIGGRNCTLRKIFAVRLGDVHGAGGTTIQGYATIADNTTTGPVVLGPTASYTVPPHQNVNPPFAPAVSPTVTESVTAVNTLAFLGRNAQAGYWAFKATGVYRDGTESRGTLASATVLMTGTKQATMIGIPIFPPINGVDCVFRRIYGSVFFHASTPTAAGIPDFDTSDTQCVAIVTDNSAVTVTFPFGSGLSGGEHTPNNVPPGEEDLPGPDLESVVSPTPITSGDPLLLLDPPITTESDTTQLRNRIIVKGRGSILAADATIGDSIVKLADVSTFSGGGGTFITGSRIIAYNGVNAGIVPPTLMLASPLMQPILQADWKFGGGTPILPIVIVNDIASQKFYGQIELDKNGQPTDGIHEFTISDDTLTNVPQLYARGIAELKLFSRPVVSLTYATRDPLTKAGKIVHVDLDKPPISGDFIIQEVTIDQIHDENDELAPRYIVTADSAARFNMNDFFLSMSGNANNKSAGASTAGLVSTAVTMAGSASGNSSLNGRKSGRAIIGASGSSLITSTAVVITDGIAATITATGGAPFNIVKFAHGLLWAPGSVPSNSGSNPALGVNNNGFFTKMDLFPAISWRVLTPTKAELAFIDGGSLGPAIQHWMGLSIGGAAVGGDPQGTGNRGIYVGMSGSSDYDRTSGPTVIRNANYYVVYVDRTGAFNKISFVGLDYDQIYDISFQVNTANFVSVSIIPVGGSKPTLLVDVNVDLNDVLLMPFASISSAVPSKAGIWVNQFQWSTY